MANKFRLVIASVGDTLYDSEAQSATFPGAAGVFEILPHHESIIAPLKEGTVVVKTGDGERKEFAVTGGIVECAQNKVVVLL